MRNFKLLALAGLSLGLCLMVAPSAANAQRIGIGIGVGPAYVGPAPVCPYGYYDDYPYACAPYGFYGPEWFTGGVFIGAGPWFHGDHGYRSYNGGRGSYGHGPVLSERGVNRGGYGNGYSGGHFSGGNSFRGGNGFHGGGGSHGGGRR